MESTTTTDGGEPNDNHPAADVDAIVVDPDEIVEMMRRNARDRDEQRTHSLRIKPPFEGEVRATPHVQQQGNFYPSEMSPKPIHLGKAAFIEGHNGASSSDFPGTARYPSRNDSLSHFRDEFDANDRELTDEEEDEWDEWWATEIEVWESEVRQHLRDETTLGDTMGVGTPRTTVQIRYESADS